MRPTPLERVLARVVVDEATGCILWTGPLNDWGYGKVWVDGRSMQVHRAVYEGFVGPIPEGLTIDHVYAWGCRHRHCVNPAHLEAVTIRENLMRGQTQAATNAAKVSCIHGHPFDEANTYVYADGRRTCRTCIRDRGRVRMRAVRAAARAAA